MGYTPSQDTVITSRGHNLLVSASAGTGKTTVMVERIYQLIVSGEVDISNLLVVTYTKLAAAEMKQRLVAKLLENSTNPVIAEQLEKIDQCSISTVHSFCTDIIRNYFYVVDVDPAYTIVDDNTASKLIAQALDDTIANTEQDDTFVQLYDMLANNRKDTNLRKYITKQYDFSRTVIDYQQWYNSCRQQFVSMASCDNQLTKLIVDSINSSFGEISHRWREAGQLFASYGIEKNTIAYNERSVEFYNTRTNIEHIVRWLCLLEMPRLPAIYKKDFATIEEYEYASGQIEELKTETKKLVGKYKELFGNNSWEQLCTITANNAVYTDKLVQLVVEFGDKYSQLKKARGMVDFSDLEHLTIAILSDEQARESIRSRYSMVFVDEYQDTNSVQDSIFSSVAGDNNLFAVGDVKQSIYAFRGSDPAVFLDKQVQFASNSNCQVVELNENFRSNAKILHFVNMVFNHIMTPTFGKVDYQGTAQLEGKLHCSSHIPPVTIDIVQPQTKDELILPELYDITIPTEGISTREGQVVSYRIRSVVGSVVTLKGGVTRRIGYGDIAILCKAYSSNAQAIYNKLLQDNIPVQTNMRAELNSGKEIRDIISLLRVLDNPTDDISVVGVCKSCIGNMTEQELAYIKIHSNEHKCSFINRLQMYRDNGCDQIIVDKCTKLLCLIDRLRLVAVSSTVHMVVLELMDSTNYHLHVQALPNGHLRSRQLYRYIDSLMGKSYNQSVDKYLQYLESDNKSEAKDNIVSHNCVRMMTIHGSKGLEFPVVIMVDGNKQPHPKTSKLRCDPSVGLALDHYDFDNMSSNMTVGGFCTTLTQDISEKEQDMRVLYVALTRAKYHLFITASGENLDSTSANSVLSANSFAKWIMGAVNANRSEITDSIEGVDVKVWSGDSQILSGSLPDNLLCAQSIDDSIVGSMNYVYPYDTNVPTKVVSSMLDKAHLDQQEADTVEALANYDNTPLLIGTAYHSVYEAIGGSATIEDIDRVIAQLVDSGTVSAEIATHVDSQLVHDTINNAELIALMQGTVYREIPFMLSTNIADVTDSSGTDNVILQGIIDMLVVNGDSAVVIDYKYVNSSYKIAERYSRQLSSYKLAVERITGISNVKCYILSIRDNKIFPVV